MVNILKLCLVFKNIQKCAKLKSCVKWVAYLSNSLLKIYFHISLTAFYLIIKYY